MTAGPGFGDLLRVAWAVGAAPITPAYVMSSSRFLSLVTLVKILTIIIISVNFTSPRITTHTRLIGDFYGKIFNAIRLLFNFIPAYLNCDLSAVAWKAVMSLRVKEVALLNYTHLPSQQRPRHVQNVAGHY